MSVHDESLTDVHVALPVVAYEEIREEDLELVAGGGVSWFDYCQQ